MKRLLTSSLLLASFSLFALVGCEDTSKTKVESSGPDGKSSVETTVKQSGSNPPPVGEAPKPEAPK
jgi:hypothetical protein